MVINNAVTAFEEQSKKLVAARYSLVFVQTHEEERLERYLRNLASRAFSQPVPLFTWTVTEGLRGENESFAGTDEPTLAIDEVIKQPRAALYLFFDLHCFFDNPRVVRKLRDMYHTCRNTYKTIFICSPTLQIPVELQKESSILDLPLPNLPELERVFKEVTAGFKNLVVEIEPDKIEDVLRGTLGLTEDEARYAFTKVLLGRRKIGMEIIEKLYDEKRELVRKEGLLDYIPPHIDLEQIGGLIVLKNWLRQRKTFFSKEADAYGLDPPKGILLTGISGCGKSMAVQAISSFWLMPMLRLDMNRVYGAIAGSPERSLELAIRTAEAVAPCILWIDEIETAIVGATGKEGSNLNTRIFSSFLTWMQEKTQIVFVAATANEIDKLPPELIRKGRFDEVFFVDLPNENDRADIFAVHMTRRNKDPRNFDLVSLAKSTNGFNGAEIEQVVLSAMYNAFSEKRELTMNDLYRSLGRMIPLSTTMSERIKEIKRWADTRAVRANG